MDVNDTTIPADRARQRELGLTDRPVGVVSGAFGVATPPNEDVSAARQLGLGVREYQEYRRQELNWEIAGTTGADREKMSPLARVRLNNQALQERLGKDDGAFRDLMSRESIHREGIENGQRTPGLGPVASAEMNMVQLSPPGRRPDIEPYMPKMP